jgi:hypothetical protein
MVQISNLAIKHIKERLAISRMEADRDLCELYQQYALITCRIGRVAKIEETIQKLDAQNRTVCVEPE